MGNRGAADPKITQHVDTQNQRGKAVTASNADSQADTLRIGDANSEGAQIYAGACAGCHQGPRAMPYGGIDLALSSGISGPSANNLINIVLYGLPAAGAARAPIMPGFASAMNDDQIAALARYLRVHFSDKGPWSDIEHSVRAARSSARAATVSPAPANQPAPPGTTQRTTHEAQR
jgi:mono/diheme cytochrome c family protein